MFETGKAIREAKLRQIWDEGREEGIRETIEFVMAALEESGEPLPPEVVERLYNELHRIGSRHRGALESGNAGFAQSSRRSGC